VRRVACFDQSKQKREPIARVRRGEARLLLRAVRERAGAHGEGGWFRAGGARADL